MAVQWGEVNNLDKWKQLDLTGPHRWKSGSHTDFPEKGPGLYHRLHLQPLETTRVSDP